MFTRNILVILFALLMFFACTGEDSRQIHEALMLAKAQNENYEPFTTDSTMLRVVDYYDSHGTANEQMLAHYLLGCVYRDLGDAPRALECYYDAVNKADTTSSDCDFQRLSRIYGQMADLFHAQRSPQFEKEAELNAVRMAWKAKDTLAALNFYAHLAYAYHLENKIDSAYQINMKVCKLFEEYGFHEFKYGYLPMQIEYFIRKKEYTKAKIATELFERESGLFDEHKNIYTGKEIYYYTKGLCYYGINRIDSALLCYKKLLNLANNIGHYENAYKGLMEVYHKLGKPDSVMKYSLLFANANDSACLISSAEEINRANAHYNYNTSRRQADAMKQKAERYKYTITIGSILAIIAVLFAIYIIIRYRRNAKKEFLELNTRYFETLDKYNQSEKDLRMLNDDINKFKTDKEKENESLRQALAQYTNSNEIKEEWDAEKYLLNCDMIKHLHNLACKGACATDAEFGKLTELTSHHLSTFYDYITAPKHSLSEREIIVCILIKLRFTPSEIAVLLECSKQVVSNIRTNINHKLFHQEGTKSLDSNIRRL